MKQEINPSLKQKDTIEYAMFPDRTVYKKKEREFKWIWHNTTEYNTIEY